MLGPKPIVPKQRGRPPAAGPLVVLLGNVLRQEVLRLGYRDRSLVVLNGEHVGAVAVADQFEDAPFVGPGGPYRSTGTAATQSAKKREAAGTVQPRNCPPCRV